MLSCLYRILPKFHHIKQLALCPGFAYAFQEETSHAVSTTVGVKARVVLSLRVVFLKPKQKSLALLSLMRILLLADIHGNWPALAAIAETFRHEGVPDLVLNCGDCTVYAPFPNEVMRWLRHWQALSVRGNTDERVIRLLRGQPCKKPKNPEKRCMYENTVALLDAASTHDLLNLKAEEQLTLHSCRIGLYHGSPADHKEFLFADTPDSRFLELAATCGQDIVCCGHSHTPFHKFLGGVHFINPGAAGRMFDGDPRASLALLDLTENSLRVTHSRVAYDVEAVVQELARHNLPAIYGEMFRLGRKLN